MHDEAPVIFRYQAMALCRVNKMLAGWKPRQDDLLMVVTATKP